MKEEEYNFFLSLAMGLEASIGAKSSLEKPSM